MNYPELQANIQRWLDRDALVGDIPTLIELFEGQIKRELRVRRMEARAVATTVAGQPLAVPNGYLEMRNLKLNINPSRTLYFMTPSELYYTYGDTAGLPQNYTIVGGEFLFGPSPNGGNEVELDYYEFFTLSDANPTNWLLEENPDVYLYGALGNANDERAGAWSSRANAIMAGLGAEDSGARWAGAPLYARPDSVTP